MPKLTRQGSRWRQRFQQAVLALRAHPDVDEVRVRMPAPAPRSSLEKAARAIGKPLPAEVLRFYQEMNGL